MILVHICLQTTGDSPVLTATYRQHGRNRSSFHGIREGGRSMIRVAIVDDEEIFTNQLVEYVQHYSRESGNEIQITCFKDGDEIVEKYTGEYDIILMDIVMRFMDGMSAAEHIRKLDQAVIIMFITNMTQYAVRGYQVDALDYILKPVEYFAFSQKLDRAIRRLKRNDQHYITIPVDGGVQKLSMENIYYIESQGHKLIYKTKMGSIISRGTMKALEDCLLPYGFFRSNKGYLVNMRYVDSVKDGCCIVHNQPLPIGRMKRKPFMEALTEYMGEVIQ